MLHTERLEIKIMGSVIVPLNPFDDLNLIYMHAVKAIIGRVKGVKSGWNSISTLK